MCIAHLTGLDVRPGYLDCLPIHRPTRDRFIGSVTRRFYQHVFTAHVKAALYVEENTSLPVCLPPDESDHRPLWLN